MSHFLPPRNTYADALQCVTAGYLAGSLSRGGSLQTAVDSTPAGRPVSGPWRQTLVTFALEHFLCPAMVLGAKSVNEPGRFRGRLDVQSGLVDEGKCRGIGPALRVSRNNNVRCEDRQAVLIFCCSSGPLWVCSFSSPAEDAAVIRQLRTGRAVREGCRGKAAMQSEMMIARAVRARAQLSLQGCDQSLWLQHQMCARCGKIDPYRLRRFLRSRRVARQGSQWFGREG